MKFRSLAGFMVFLFLSIALARAVESSGDWLEKVPQKDRAQTSPIRAKAATITQGHKTFLAHCAQCHGEDAKGTGRAPALVSNRVRTGATDGDLHWLLVNGNRDRGMPPWEKLGDLQLWRVITYLRSLQ
ncbi:MAG TPA: c-type cytochrome [Terriglobales bacterium]|nr:c-type cytochrome [Terriglobales bacterium]